MDQRTGQKVFGDHLQLGENSYTQVQSVLEIVTGRIIN